MSKTPVFDAVAAEYPGIHRASNIFPQPAPEPHINFIKEKGSWELTYERIAYGYYNLLKKSDWMLS